MSALDYFQQREVEVSWGVPGTAGKPRQTEGWVYGDWAITKGLVDNDGYFLITHLPTGFALPARFDAIEDAAACLMQVVPLRNDWSNLTPEDLPPLKPRIIALLTKFNGKALPRNRVGSMEARRNGYDGMAS